MVTCKVTKTQTVTMLSSSKGKHRHRLDSFHVLLLMPMLAHTCHFARVPLLILFAVLLVLIMPLVDASSGSEQASNTSGTSNHQAAANPSGSTSSNSSVRSDSSDCDGSQVDEAESQNNDSDGAEAAPSLMQQLEDLENQKARWQRQARTFKARAASLVSKARNRLARTVGAQLQAPSHPAESYRADVQDDSVLHQPGQYSPYPRNRRLRLLVSYLRAWGSALMEFFTWANSSGRTVHHTILSTIIDDTNMRLTSSAVEDSVPQWKSSRVVSVMNTVQAFTLSYSGAEAEAPCHKTFSVHTPLVTLPKTDKDSICAQLVDRMITFAGHVSRRFTSLGISSSFANQIPIQGLTICFDSLVTNLSVLKRVRAILHKQHTDRMDANQSGQQIHPMLAVTCLIHQLALSRKCLITGFDHYYSSIVRLGHLFEVSSFRTQFKRALLAVIYDSYHYIPCASLPEGADEWKRQRRSIVGILADDSTRQNSKRVQLHLQLSVYDNCNPDSDMLQHFCIGTCCRGKDHKSKAQFGLTRIAQGYCNLFGIGYPVPLTYRWVHAARALQFVKEPWSCQHHVFCNLHPKEQALSCRICRMKMSLGLGENQTFSL